jgi:hypothetical protein
MNARWSPLHGPGQMRPEPTAGLRLVALYLGYRAARRGVELMASQPDLGDPGTLLLRLLTVMGIALGGVTAVALWRMEHWAGDAVAALAALSVFRMLVSNLGKGGLPLWDVLTSALVYAAILAVVVMAVRNEVRSAYAPRLRITRP